METRKLKKLNSDDLDRTIFNVHEYGINAYSREIFLHSHVDELSEDEIGMDYRMAANFIKNIAILNQQGKDNVLIHQHSCGGDWQYGLAIYDAILYSVAPVTILAYAHARSMSSITLQAAKIRVLMPDCCFLVHYGDISYTDRLTPVLSDIDFIKKFDIPRMMDIYAGRCKGSEFFKKMSKTNIIKYIKGKLEKKTDWILTAKEAVYYGFADGILGSKGFDISKIRG